MAFDDKRIKELSKLMDRLGLCRLAFKEKGGEIELEKAPVHPPQAPHYTTSPHLAAHPSNIYHPPAPQEGQQGAQASSGKAIKSPLVGTFYVSNGPGEAPFVKVGDTVSENTVVAIIEAMKVMNEIKAGVSGKITAQLVEDGQPVEFDSPLFKVE